MKRCINKTQDNNNNLSLNINGALQRQFAARPFFRQVCGVA